MICLVHDGADRVLLARQPIWPAGRYSVLAGFVEAGESLEACVARECAEEVGVDVHTISYLGSQPWPFPRSLMIGFSAVADPDQPIKLQEGEIEGARWVTRAELREALDAGEWSHRDGKPARRPGRRRHGVRGGRRARAHPARRRLHRPRHARGLGRRGLTWLSLRTSCSLLLRAQVPFAARGAGPA